MVPSCFSTRPSIRRHRQRERSASLPFSLLCGLSGHCQCAAVLARKHIACEGSQPLSIACLQQRGWQTHKDKEASKDVIAGNETDKSIQQQRSRCSEAWLAAQVFLEDAGFDWKILGPDAGDLDYVAWQCDQDAYACSGQKCSAQSLLFAHENYIQAGLITHSSPLAITRSSPLAMSCFSMNSTSALRIAGADLRELGCLKARGSKSARHHVWQH